MTTCIALLRAINLGSHKKVAMADLKAMLVHLRFEDPRTVLQTGNLVFGSAAGRASDLEGTLAAEAVKRLALDTDFFVRDAGEWRAIIAQNPFPKMAKGDPAHLVLLCLKDDARASDVRALQASIAGREVVKPGGRHLYVTYPDGIGESKLTLARIEKALRTRATGRNWNTVLKIGALADEVTAGRGRGGT